jgi:hypothetical protein
MMDLEELDTIGIGFGHLVLDGQIIFNLEPQESIK